MAGRPRLPIGTYGTIQTTELARGRVRAQTRFRDWDGQTRQVVATGESRNAAVTALKVDLNERMRHAGTQGSLTPDSRFADLADAWLDDLRLDVERAESTKETYGRQLRTQVLPFFEDFAVREITVGRIERYLKQQRQVSYSMAKHSKTTLSMVLAFGVRQGLLERNPVKETSQLKKPKRIPKALTSEELAAIRTAASEFGTDPNWMGPRPDGQVRDLIEVMLGTATRIGEALAIRKCDVDVTADPPRVEICGTIIHRTGVPVYRQEHPKTKESNRVVPVPSFAAAVIRRRLASLPADAEPEQLLFYSKNGTPLMPANVRRQFRRILDLAGLGDAAISPHAFRRTGATAIAHELGLQAAADLLGHTSTAVTKEHYAEPDRSVTSRPAAVLQRLAPEPASEEEGTDAGMWDVWE
ncbi:tyrosine-type recombinase/integrase [Agromyces sp. ISL-38]|uniref:tyrosine-type recombinase/integrase n=1 Tax=Agromyces sp. ISL-38 TaxID=2819107 RepID=UPI001BE66E3C|nr:tyrosine-type recombinase/integrase [Agromyces sp. ISL-38]MBT2498526.1 tyrosine-type recombinase/integrase [Agromyces sp. ISL-38]